MFDTTLPVDAARAWLTELMPSQAKRIEEATDVMVKASMDSAYAGGWAAFLRQHEDQMQQVASL